MHVKSCRGDERAGALRSSERSTRAVAVMVGEAGGRTRASYEVPPDGGGDTMFANMYIAYETLSAPIRKLIDGLSAIHDGEHLYRGRYKVDETGKTFPCAEHPIVRTHPVTGKRCLFVNRVFTTRIVGLRKRESDAILEMLYRHVETPEFSVRFKWQPNSIAFWDNRCVQHQALWDYYPYKRYGHRVTICGDKPS